LLKKKFILSYLLIWATCLWSAAITAAPEKPKLKDIRVLIDVSDDMLHSDPENMRAMGLKLFAKLLPNGTTAGVWTFDGNPYNLVPLGIVSPQWTKDAIDSTTRIHSNGQMSDIAAALNVASLGWTSPNYDKIRNIILISDGKVQVSAKSDENDESKAHILQTMVPNFQNLGVKINSIALSGQGDVELLRKMAIETDGYFCQVSTASELQRAFLRILDFNVVPDGIPISENKFTVDQHIQELVLVLYSNSIPVNRKQSFVKLKSPDGSSYDHNNLGSNMVWYQEGYMNIITIKDPQIGEWSFAGALDLNKRAYVFSDIDLELNQLPGNVFIGEKIYLTAMLMEKDTLMVNSPLADMTAVTAVLNPGTRNESMFVYNDAADEDGSLQKGSIYRLNLGPIPETQNGDLVIQTTFAAYPVIRQKQQRLIVLPTPIDVQVTADVDAAKQKVMVVNVSPDSSLILPNSLLVTINMQDNDGKVLRYQIPRDNNGQHKLLISPDPGITSYDIQFDLIAKTLQGRDIILKTSPMLVTVPQVTLPEPRIITIQPTTDKISEEEKLAKEKAMPVGKTILLVFLFLIVNIMILSIVYMLIKLIKRQRNEKINIMSKNIR
jgi:hypothetical protein